MIQAGRFIFPVQAPGFWIRTHNPAVVIGMKVDRNAAERAAPFHHCGIEVRCEIPIAFRPPRPLIKVMVAGSKHRNAVPQDISAGRANK